MADYDLNFTVTGSRILCADNFLSADSVDFVYAAFTFDESWSGLVKSAIFRMGEKVYSVPLENNRCAVPHEVIKEGVLFVSAFGVLGTTRATTAEYHINIEKSGYVSVTPSAPTADPYNYFLQKATELKTAAEAAKDSCDTALSGACTAEQNALETLADIEQKADEIDLAVTAAAQYKNAAQGYSNSAEASKNAAAQSASSAKSSASTAATAADEAEEQVMKGIEAHNSSTNSSAHPNLVSMVNEAKSIAMGKATSLSFSTKSELESWLSGNFTRTDGKTTADLNVGDNLYIVELGVPDYWWDGTTARELGAEKPTLTDYYTKQEIDGKISGITMKAMSESDYNSAYVAGTLVAGCIYFVTEDD